jgi:hypothetical protein
MNENKKRRFLPYSLGALQAFIGLSAIMGGFKLVSDPSGANLDLSLEWLANSPFPDYFIPGLVLLIGIGVGHVLAAIVNFLRNRYAGGTAFVFGIFLILYLAIEVWIIGLQTFLQPLFFVLGAIELIFGLKLSKSSQTVHQKGIESTELSS